MVATTNTPPAQDAPQPTETVADFNPFDAANWTETPGSTDVPRETTPEISETPEATPEARPETAPVETPAPWYSAFGYESEEAAKAEIEALRAQKAAAPEISFASEASRQLFEAIREGKEDEVYSILAQKQRLQKAADLPAEAALRLHLELANPHYSAEDIQDVMEERYALPVRPVRDELDSDEEWAAKEGSYQSQLAKVTRRMERDAVSARADLLAKLPLITLPDIPGQPKGDNQPAQSSAEVKAIRQTYLQTLERDFAQFDGFSATYKDEEVEVPVSYQLSADEKVALKERLKNFDVDGFILSRWFRSDGTPNVVQLMSDVYRLENGEKIAQKQIQEAVAQRLVHERKKSANIHVTGPNPTATPAARTDAAALAEFFFSH